ncbi:MAG: DUF6516 family protein [Anaerolineales bacterium]
MTTLPAMLGALTAVLQSHPLCGRIEILETREFSPAQFYFKVRAELPQGHKLQTRVYSNFGHIDYAYQLFKEGAPLLRWDNKEEFHSVKTYPHHHHDERGNIRPSPLTADPQADIVLVLQEIEKFLAGR